MELLKMHNSLDIIKFANTIISDIAFSFSVILLFLCSLQ